MRFPIYETNNRKARSEVAHVPAAAGDAEISEILTWRWGAAFAPTTEADAKVVTRSEDLVAWLDRELDTQDLRYGPLTPLMRYCVVSRPLRFTALTLDSRLMAVVDRDELAQRSTLVELEHRLS